jgi:hypothetical protein
MDSPYGFPGFKPEAAFAGAAERFFDMLKTFGMPGAAVGGAAGAARDWSSLAAPLAGQFEQWLRSAQSSGPWFGGAGAPGAGAFAAGANAFGPLPLGPAAAPQPDAQRSLELVARLAQLQGRLAAHWSEIAASAAQRFVARAAAQPPGAATLEGAMRLYELWVSCAEESYASTVRKDEFAHLQAELANTSAALLVEQRRHAETLMRAFGLPSRNEVDALYAQLKELRAQLAGLAAAPERTARPGAAPARAPRAARRSSRKGRRKPRA